MPEIMEAEICYTCTTYRTVPCIPYGSGACPCGIGKHQGGIETPYFPVFTEEGKGDTSHMEGTSLPVLCIVEGDGSTGKVHVLPSETQ
jgi:hypothetical protein